MNGIIMDKSGVQQDHSKEKLDLYSSYLELYLLILSEAANNPKNSWLKFINVYDLFAGSGYDILGNEGSAVRAKKVISNILDSDRYKSTSIRLFVNEPNEDAFLKLKNAVGDRKEVCLSSFEADVFIKNWQKIPSSVNLFFLDPFGYTQFGVREIRKIISSNQCETLIFVPTSFIYWFKNSDSVQAAPVKRYLSELGIDSFAVRNCKTEAEFAELIKFGMMNSSGAKYGYCHNLRSVGKSNLHSVIFLTKNELGADKFLYCKAKLKKKIIEDDAQLGFGFIEPPEVELINDLKTTSKILDNLSLYKLGLEKGFHSSEITVLLNKLLLEGKIRVESISEKKAKQGSYYISWEHFVKNSRRISIKFLDI